MSSTAPLILTAPATERQGSAFYDYHIILSEAYLDCILEAGGLPVVIPSAPNPKLVAEYVSRTDGLMLTGGDDIQPELYTNEVSPELRKTVEEVDKKRDLLETLLIAEALEQRKPIFAICRGHQILNVALGGTLIIDIGSQVNTAMNHSVEVNKDRYVHSILIEEDSMMFGIFGKQRVEVNSSHHQAVDKVAPVLRVTARSEDGLIEALELKKEEQHRSPYLLGVQFHPERLTRGSSAFVKLFQSFTTACARNRKLR